VSVRRPISSALWLAAAVAVIALNFALLIDSVFFEPHRKNSKEQNAAAESQRLIKFAYGLGYMDAIKGCLESNIIKGPITLVASNGPAFFCSNRVTIVVVKRDDAVSAVHVSGGSIKADEDPRPVAVTDNTFIGLSNNETTPEDIAQNQRNWDETLTRIQATSPTPNPESP